jgi:hypothetical protein
MAPFIPHPLCSTQSRKCSDWNIDWNENDTIYCSLVPAWLLPCYGPSSPPQDSTASSRSKSEEADVCGCVGEGKREEGREERQRKKEVFLCLGNGAQKPTDDDPVRSS